MDNGMAQVLESVFGRRELDAVSVEEIRGLIAEFPSFNAGHYFLSRKLRDGDAIEYAAATRQTALYFNNPLWLQHLLEDRDTKPDQAGPAASEHYAYWPLIAPEPASGEASPENPEEPKFDSAVGNQTVQTSDEEIPTVNETMHSVEPEMPTWNEAIHTAQEGIPTVNEMLDPEPLTAHSLNDILQPPTDEEMAAYDAGQPSENEALLNLTFGGVNQEDSVSPDDLPQPDPMYDDNPSFEWPAESTPDLTVSTEKEPVGVPATSGEPDSPEARAEQLPAGISAGLAAAAAELLAKKPVGNAFDEKKAKLIVFEPYHTIDYFASQGIKLVLDDIPGDTFGRQLKSFTEWLKIMKRLPVQPLTGKADETETAEVKTFAAHSVEDRDILTETMAEVLVKQGMNDNAIAIYNKLSLIYPLKSAYFAARIEQLKASRP